MKKLLCFLGWHKWTWLLTHGFTIYLSRDIPDNAKCARCGIKYKTGKK